MLNHLVQELRYSVRGLLGRPLFALVAVLSLGLSIGVNTAIYSLYHQAVMRELPVADPAGLVNLSAPGPKQGNTSNNTAGPRDDIFSFPMYLDLAREQTPFEGIAAHRALPVNVAFRRSSESGNAMLVSGNYFGLLGLQPARGRLLQASDDTAPGASAVAVLSHAYWQNTLGGADDVLGSNVRINGHSFEIVGVAPPGFAGTTFGITPQVFVPITQRWALQPQADRDHEDRQSYWVYLFARLRPGMTPERAAVEINLPYRRLIENVEAALQTGMDSAAMEQFVAKQVILRPGARGQSSAALRAATPLVLLLGAAALVLVVACLNIANLMLARGADRAGEIAIRASIGASRSRLVGQLLSEALLLAVLGGLLALPLAQLALQLLGGLIPVSGAGSFQLQLDAVAMQFAALVALATTLLFGLFPALQLARTEPGLVLRSESSRTGASRSAVRFRAALAIAQIAFSMTSLVLAGLFLQSLSNLTRVDLGMQLDHVATFTVSPARNGYTPERSAVLFAQIEQRLAALPGVESAAGSMVPLLSHNEWGSNISLRGFEDAPPDQMTVAYNMVGSAYLRSLTIPLLAGRDLVDSDTAGAPKVALVNRRFAEQFGLGPNPIGQRMAFGARDELDIEIVGLVEDASYSDVRGVAPAQILVPWRQDASLGTLSFYVRSTVQPETLLAQFRTLVAELDPELPVEDLRTMPQQLDVLLNIDRFVGTLATSFATLATLLAALGLYGMLSYTLSQRMREIGLRLALGAAPQRLQRMVMTDVARLVGIGAVFGLGAAWLLGRQIGSLLFGLQGHDSVVLLSALAILVAVALLSGWLPAQRVARVDPIEALRHD